MSKAVLISIRPEWVEKILNREKTLEVRKTRPKLETPFKCYIYCTNSGVAMGMCGKHGKVVGEFTCNKVTNFFSNSRFWLNEDDVLQTCLSAAEIRKYANGANGLYGWHISDLVVYNKPKVLNEFWFPPELYCEKERCGGCPYDQVADANGEYSFDCEWKRPLTRPPQSWCYMVESDG